MNTYFAEFKLNKKKSENCINMKKMVNITTLLLISLLLFSAPITLFSTSTYAQTEPDYETILNDLGFTNIAQSNIETFPAGTYHAILYAELGGYAEINVLSYYPVLTENYQTIFIGPEGATYGSDGFIDPPYPNKIFEADTEFGLSLLSSFRFFTEDWRNSGDQPQHAKIYENLDSPNMLLIGFEDSTDGDQIDFNDMVLSLTQVLSPKIVSVMRTPENPSSDLEVTITAQVIKGNADIESVVLSYQIGSSSWTNVTMSLNGENYQANIPGQPLNTQVNYKIFAVDVEGASDVTSPESYTVLILSRSPIAVLTYSPTVAYTDELVEFDSSSSYDSDGTIVSYFWDFGDGNTATSATVGHSFKEDGEYLITLKITDNEGLVGGKVAIQVIKNRPPVAAITVSKPIIKNEEVVFYADSSYDPDGTIISYTWSFGDGSAATGIAVAHTFANTGVYSITLAINDNDGAIDEQKLTVYVTETIPDGTNNRPLASFTAIPKIVSIDETVFFDASESIDSDGSIVTYLWDFGDGNTATGVTVNHAYSEEGTYTITLTVTDNTGAIDIDSNAVSATIQATPNQNPLASFSKSKQTTSTGESIHFDATESYDTDGLVISYTWDLGDGNTATGAEIDHIYKNMGNYTITLTITDSNGATSKTTSSVTITNAFPVATFTKSAEAIKIDETVFFDASESIDSDGSIVTYLWDFGDGNTATGVTVNHAYSEEGTYTITLTVTDNTGDSSSVISTITTETDINSSLDLLSLIGLVIAILTAIILIALLARRRN